MWEDLLKTKEFELGKRRMKELLKREERERAGGVNLEALEVLKLYGLPIASYAVVRSKDEVYQVAHEIGYPLVLKAITSKVIHKGDVGAVALGVREEEVVRAYPAVLGEVATRMPWLTLTGVLVQEMVEGKRKHELRLERDKKGSFPFRGIVRLFKGEREVPEVREVEVESGEQLSLVVPMDMWESPDEVPLSKGLWAVWLQHPQIKVLEVDVVSDPAPPTIVDAKFLFFET